MRQQVIELKAGPGEGAERRLEEDGVGSQSDRASRHRGTGGAKALRQNIRDAHEVQDWANGADGLMGEHHLGPCGPM